MAHLLTSKQVHYLIKAYNKSNNKKQFMLSSVQLENIYNLNPLTDYEDLRLACNRFIRALREK